MMKLIALAAVLASGPLAGTARALDRDSGTAGGQFLKLGGGARAGGMADSFSAIADDVSAVYYNPAGLSQLKGMQFAGSHTSLFQGLDYEAFQFAYPWGREEGYSRHVLAVGIQYLAVSKIERRSGDSTDALGTFGSNDGAYGLTYAYAVNAHFSAALTGKLVSQHLDNYSSNAFAADAGVLYRVNPAGARPLNLAVVVRNLGQRAGFAGGVSDPLPLSVTWGLGYHVWKDRLLFNVEGTKYRDDTAFGAVGAEYRHPFADQVSGALRAGYSNQRSSNPGLNGLAVGAGIGYYKAYFDFAWLPFGVIGNTFRYSLLLKF